MEYVILAVASALVGAGGGAYLHYRYGASVKRVADIVKAAAEQAKK